MGPKNNGASKRNVITIEDKTDIIKRFDKGEKVSVIARAIGFPRSTVSTIIHEAMGPKNDVASKRNVVTMEDKTNIIKRFDKGEKVSVIARAIGFPRSTVSTIIHDRERILAYITEKGASANTHVINVKRGRIFDEMEKLLSVWIEQQNHERIPSSQLRIQEKAKSLFKDLLKKYPEEKKTTFVASNGWFWRFKRRFSLHNGKMQGKAATAVPVKDMSKNLVSLIAELEMELKDFNGSIQSEKQPLANNDLLALEEQHCVEDELTELNKFTLSDMKKGFYHLSKCLAIFETQDPNAERFAKIKKDVDDIFLPYRTILNKSKKHTIKGTLDQFLLTVAKRKTLESSTDEPTPSTSGASPKKPRLASSPAASLSSD